MPRKRFNAFDDFPAGDQSSNEWEPVPEDQPAEELPQQTSSLFGARVLAEPNAPMVERIERLKPSQMMPDRFQPRRLLPTSLRQPFYTGQINCYQAARQWLQMAKNDSGIQKEVDRLLAMGISFEEHGQIKPVTGSWVEMNNGDYIFQIETGERRFWAACLQYVAHKLKDEPQLRVEVVPAPTRMRQVLENRHAEPPSAVGQACEVASLILAELGISPEENTQDEFDYFRQVRQRRMPTGFWDKITPVMQLTRERMVQLMNILDLPTPLLDLADRYRVPERVLRGILRAPEPQWDALLRESIKQDWTSDDVAAATQKQAPKAEKADSKEADPYQQSLNAFKRFVSAIEKLGDDDQDAVLDGLANDFVVANQGEQLLILLRNLSERVRIREQNRLRRR